jgi:hypothetical protein
MPRRARACVLIPCVVLALVGCQETDASRPLPAPEPPATATLTPPRDDAPVKKRPAADEGDRPAPKRPSDTEPAKAPATPDAPEPAAQAGTSSGGSAAAPSPAEPVPPVTTPSAACLARCQSSMQSCLSQPVDGGVPGFGNLELCKNALAACRAACP